MDTQSIFLPFGIFYGQLVYFVVILAYFSRFGILYKEKSSNPGTGSAAAVPSEQKLIFQLSYKLSSERVYILM
jgi:hypothetical protein